MMDLWHLRKNLSLYSEWRQFYRVSNQKSWKPDRLKDRNFTSSKRKYVKFGFEHRFQMAESTPARVTRQNTPDKIALNKIKQNATALRM